MNTQFIHAWILYQMAEEKSPHREKYYWAEEKMQSFVSFEPELALVTFMDILKLEVSDQVLSCLATGPLVDFFVLHGSKFISYVTERAQNNLMFKELLGRMDQNTISDNVWEQIISLRGSSD